MTLAVDFDQTLAFHKPGMGIGVLGKPITRMLKRVKQEISKGREVVIFTARGGQAKQVALIQDWLEEHGLPRLRVTNVKLPEFEEMWDDRARQVVANKGIIVHGHMPSKGKKRRVTFLEKRG